MAAIFIAALLVIGGCTSLFTMNQTAAQIEKRNYPAETALYPAVYGTISELYPDARFLDIDFYNNSYVISGISGMTKDPNAILLSALETFPISYDLTIRVSQSGEINMSYSNIYVYRAEDQGTGFSGRVNSLGTYDFNQTVNEISSRMLAIAGDSAAFDKYEKAAMADIKFVYIIMKDFTGLAFRDFIDNYAKGSIFSISGPIANVREANRQINGSTYKYAVTLTQRLRESNSGYVSTLLSEYVYCTFYTNKDEVIRLNRSATLSVNGTLVGASQSTIETGISLELVDAN